MYVVVKEGRLITKQIELSKGFYTLVDEDDYEWISQWKWYYSNGYAVRNERLDDGRRRRVVLHRLILGLGVCDDVVVDHINGNGLDNRKGNLRICSHKDNVKNRKPSKGRLKGVSKSRTKKESWTARISVDKKLVNIGSFASELSAANAYNYYAKKYHGDFAYLNDVPFMPKELWMSLKGKYKNEIPGVRELKSGRFLAYVGGKNYVTIGTFNTLNEAVESRENFIKDKSEEI